MTLDQLRILVKVVDAGSFTAAADVLGVQRSNVSRVIAQLEAELGVTLLERTTRRQSLSEAGRAVYERAVGVLAAIEDTVRVTQDLQAQPQGQLRITCGVAFGIAAVSDWIETFLARHPQCTAEIEYASRELDLVHEGFDLAIRAGPLPDSRLAARQLGSSAALNMGYTQARLTRSVSGFRPHRPLCKSIGLLSLQATVLLREPGCCTIPREGSLYLLPAQHSYASTPVRGCAALYWPGSVSGNCRRRW